MYFAIKIATGSDIYEQFVTLWLHTCLLWRLFFFFNKRNYSTTAFLPLTCFVYSCFFLFCVNPRFLTKSLIFWMERLASLGCSAFIHCLISTTVASFPLEMCFWKCLITAAISEEDHGRFCFLRGSSLSGSFSALLSGSATKTMGNRGERIICIFVNKVATENHKLDK